MTEAAGFKAVRVLDSLLETVTGHTGLGLCFSAQIVVASSQSCGHYSCLDLVCGNVFNLPNSLQRVIRGGGNVYLPKFNAWALCIMLIVYWLKLCVDFC